MDAYFDFVVENRNFATMITDVKQQRTRRVGSPSHGRGPIGQETFAGPTPARGPGSWNQVLFTRWELRSLGRPSYL